MNHAPASAREQVVKEQLEAKRGATESGARVAALRKQAGLSQTALAEAIGVPQRTISFYERESGYIPSTLVPPLAITLGVSIEYLLGISDGAQIARRGGPSLNSECQLEAIATQQQKILTVV